MPIQFSNQPANIKLSGRFDISVCHEFQHIYENILKQDGLQSIDIDLSDVNYIDSSALGMLLLLRRTAEPTGIDIILVNSHGAVRQILEVANFHKLFTLR